MPPRFHTWQDITNLPTAAYGARLRQACVFLSGAPIDTQQVDNALLTHLRLARHGAQGERRRNKAANWSTAEVQDHLRGLLWDDMVTYLQEKHHNESVLMDLERLRVA
jgi:hypothetical protein